MAAPYLNSFETETIGTLPTGWAGLNSPASASNKGNALVTDQAPLFGSRSLAFAAAADGMVEQYTPISAVDSGIVFCQRIRVGSGGFTCEAGALVGFDGTNGLVCTLDGSLSKSDLFLAPSYKMLFATSTPVGTTVGRALVDNDLIWFRAEQLGSQGGGTARFRFWLHGSAEPTGWAFSFAGNGITTARTNGFRLFVGASGGSAMTVDQVQVYDLLQLNPAQPISPVVGDTTMGLYAVGASGGTGPYTYQWQRAAHGATLAPIGGATSLIFNDSGLVQATSYDYALVTTDSTGATATSPIQTVLTTGVRPPTVTGVSVTPPAPTVPAGATQQFAATVNGTNNPSQSVTWAASLGSISATGLLTAPPLTNAAQSLTVTATSVFDPTQSGTATVTVPAATPPSVGTVTVSSADGVDLITYPAPVVGSRPISTVALLVGTTPGGQSAVPAAINIGGGPGSFAFPAGAYRYKLIATDTGTPALTSAPSAEVAGAIAPRGLPTTFAQTGAIVRNVLSTFFPPDLLAGLAKLKANTLGVDLISVVGSSLAASNLRDQAINQTVSQTTLDAFGSVAATQVQTQINAALPPDLLAGLAKLKAATLDVNVVQFAGSADAATHLRDEELSQTIPAATVTGLAAATAARIAIPSVSDTATAVWTNSTRTLTASPNTNS